MRKPVEISDRFDSASESQWLDENWHLEPHTRDIKKLLFPTVLVALLGTFVYAIHLSGSDDRWKQKMWSLYAPYNDAVTELQRLELCGQPWCLRQREELEQQKKEAWREVCKAEKAEEYIELLRLDNKPYQPCD